MGKTSAGKTTIASRFVERIREKGISVIHFDGDEIRNFYGPNHGFSSNERLRVVSTLVYLANKAHNSGMCVVVSALTANADARKYINENVKSLVRVFIHCDISKCIERDPKGLYKAAKQGEIKTLIGYNSKYVPPEEPFILIDTNFSSIEENVEQLLYLTGN